MAVTTSRAFRVRGPHKPAAQLPLIDMCNHSFAPNCQARLALAMPLTWNCATPDTAGMQTLNRCMSFALCVRGCRMCCLIGTQVLLCFHYC